MELVVDAVNRLYEESDELNRWATSGLSRADAAATRAKIDIANDVSNRTSPFLGMHGTLAL